MKRQVAKTVLFGILTVSILGSFASAETTDKAPNIESVNPWPQDISHGDDVYIDVKVNDDATVEDAWTVVRQDGERLKSGTLRDSNNDGYYVSPVAFKAEGGKTYEITVKANDPQGNQASETVQVNAECSFSIAQTCIR